MAASSTQNVNVIRIAMVGKTGVGKSDLGNNLLQEKVFVSASCGSLVPSKSESRSRLLEDGQKLVIVDTPGLFDTKKSNRETATELVRCIGLTSPGPHVFLFVMSVGRFTNEDRETINNLKDIFGEQVMNFVVILFTCKDKLIHDELTLGEYLEECPDEVKSIIEECKGRCVAINNRADPVNLAKDVEDILKVVRETIQSNNGAYYTGDMYEAAGQVFKEKMQKIEEKKQRMDSELDDKERKLEEEMKEQKQKLEEERTKQLLKEEESQRRDEEEKQKLEEQRQALENDRKKREMEERNRLEEERLEREKVALKNEEKRIELEKKIEEQLIQQERRDKEIEEIKHKLEMERKRNEQLLIEKEREAERQKYERKIEKLEEENRRLDDERLQWEKRASETEKKLIEAEGKVKMMELEQWKK